MGTPLFVVKNGLHLFVARDILAKYEVYRWDSYNGKTSYKIISVAYSMIFLHQTSSKNGMGKYDGQACPAIVFSHMASLRYKKPKHHLITTDLLMESNPHLINTNHIILYIHIILPLLYR